MERESVKIKEELLKNLHNIKPKYLYLAFDNKFQMTYNLFKIIILTLKKGALPFLEKNINLDLLYNILFLK